MLSSISQKEGGVLAQLGECSHPRTTKLDMVGHTCNLITREVEGRGVILEVVFGHITSLSRDREGNGERGGRRGERFLLNFLAPSLTLSSQ